MSGQKKSELSRRARIERKNRILSVPLSLSRARSFAKFSPLAMSQLTNSARASFSASMGSLGGATTPLVLVEIGAADSRGASACGTSIDSAASAAAARGRANGGSSKVGTGVDLPLVGGVQSLLLCCCSGDEGQLLLLAAAEV